MADDNSVTSPQNDRRLQTGAAPALTPLGCMADHVSAIARRAPNAPAVVFRETRWSYRELDDRVRSTAAALRERGIRRGDCVATLSTPRPEFLLSFLAVGKLGGVWMGLNPRYRAQELEWLLADAQPVLVNVLSSVDDDAIRGVRAAGAGGNRFTISEFGGDCRGPCDFVTAVTQAPAPQPAPPADDPALLVYTSGSTGRPKGALISHFGLTYGSLVQLTEWGVERPRMVCNLPIDHVGCVADICSVVLVGGGTIVFQDKFSPDLMFDAIAEEGVTVWGGVPSMFQLMLDHPRFPGADLSGIEMVLWGGAAMPRPLIDRLRDRGLRLKGAYGMTETSCHVAFTRNDAAADELERTIGRPTRYTPCRVADEAGRPCGVGVTGELQVHGRQNFLGYLRQPEATAAAFTADGWLKTGDLAAWTPSGELRLVGRLRDVIKSGGYSVFPREIEMAIESYPGVGGCAVVGAPDPLYQEVGVAFVVLEGGGAGTQGLEDFLRSRLANYKVPKRIVPLEALPILPIGKIDKNALRALAIDLCRKGH